MCCSSTANPNAVTPENGETAWWRAWDVPLAEAMVARPISGANRPTAERYAAGLNGNRAADWLPRTRVASVKWTGCRGAV
jgi:hypothetical protein